MIVWYALTERQLTLMWVQCCLPTVTGFPWCFAPLFAHAVVSPELEILDGSCVCWHCHSFFSFSVLVRQVCRRSRRALSKMPVLQPVLKMKVDELFFKWLSDPETQAQLKDYLELIKSGQPIDLGTGAAEDRKSSSSSSFNENNYVPSKKSHGEKKTASISTSSSPPSTSALPTGSSSNPRVSGPSARVLRRSLSTKKVKCRNTGLNKIWMFLRYHFTWGSFLLNNHKTRCVLRFSLYSIDTQGSFDI